MSDLFSELLESRHTIKSRLTREGDKWNRDNLGLGDYNAYFSQYAGTTIDDLVRSIHGRKKMIKVVNFMGGTKVLRDIGAEESFAFRLTDDRTPDLKEEDRIRNITLITGDVLSKKSWHNCQKILTFFCLCQKAVENIFQ